MRDLLSLHFRSLRAITPLLGPAFCCLLMLASCGPKKQSRKLPAAPSSLGSVERGIASWYGEPYHGRRAANGEVYDMNQLTAAHRTLPFGTWVQVRNETNGKTTEVRITDRGPFVEKRIIDLSRKAAELIDLLRAGIAPVTITTIRPPQGGVIELYGVQVAAYAERERAALLREKLERGFGEARLMSPDASSPLYRVMSGGGTREEANELLRRLRAAGFGGFVVRLDGAALYPQTRTIGNQ